MAHLSTLIAVVAAAQVQTLPVEISNRGAQVGQPWTGAVGITRTVAELQEREYAIPPEERAAPIDDDRHEQSVDRTGLKQNPFSPAVAQWPPTVAKFGDTAWRGGGPYLPQTIGTNFIGPTLGESNSLPPDSQGAVGPTQVLIHVNGRIKVYSKAGAVGGLNVSASTFWNDVRNGEGTSDPRVRFDRLTNRWILCMITVGRPNRIMIAVSSGPTITNQSSFTFFQFQQDQPAPAGNTGELADYPTLGVDKDALYIGTNNFGASFTGTTGFVIRKSSVLGAGPIVVTAFRNLCTNGAAGPFTPQGVDNDDPASTTGYFVGVDNISFGKLVLRRVSTPGGTPTISGDIALTVPSTTFPINVPALGSTATLDGLEDRLYAAAIRLNRLTGIRSLWTAHNIQVNTSGVAQSGGGRNGSRWYEIRNFTGTPTLTQSGTLFDSSATNPDNYWIPSITMSGQGHVALGASVAGAARRTAIAAAGRLSGDALGTTRAATFVSPSAFNYNAQGSSPQRWGDYSRTVVDPVDDMTMWTFQEVCNATDSWAVRAVQLLAPPPAAIATVTPNSVTQGQTTNLTVSGTSSNGSGFFDPGAGFTGRLAATVSGTGVTVNSVTFTTPTSMSINVTVASNSPAGARNITVTNPDGQSVVGSGVLTVNQGGAVALSAVSVSPTAVLNGAKSTGTVTLNQVTPANFNVALSSSNTAVATVATPVTVLGGTSSRNFTVNTRPVAATSIVTITASRNGVIRTATLTVQFGPALESLYVLPNSIKGGQATNGLVALTTVPASNFNVALSSNSAFATVTTPQVVLAGTTTKLFPINTSVTASTRVVTITAQRSSIVKTQTLTITP